MTDTTRALLAPRARDLLADKPGGSLLADRPGGWSASGVIEDDPDPLPACCLPLPPDLEEAYGRGGSSCLDGGLGDSARDFFSTKVCPAMYRRAMEQGAPVHLRIPPLLLGWCGRRRNLESEAAQPRSWGRSLRGLRGALADALAALRSRPIVAE
jgi:hypothetical protein